MPEVMVIDVMAVVAYDSKIVGKNFEELHTHEGADTLIPHQAISASSTDEYRDIYVFSTDTDVFILLMDPDARGRLPTQNNLTLITGKKKQPSVNIADRVRALGQLLGISKKTWMKIFLDVDEDDPVIDTLAKLGDELIPTHRWRVTTPAKGSR